ncbi:uncharacterized protein TM35_000122890 [Trypanosoma theileri]|uniref:Surface protein TolT n=1 Tax=Trypanosoma theileri TaxID=67003 RepID=A0A1X0NXW0_9TRYP|nr:uncharacterized protein TM35_000122890 [Trypanosoma theileri]ORC89514.1 hypothetical protein TM35_000122890 [Trypanosoma theileri]
MTTMFVQLRRVVYLLVLLQCCVCVAYAESDVASTDSEEKNILQRMRELTSEMEKGKSKKESAAALLNKAREECKTTAERAQNAVNKAREDEKVIIEAAAPNIMGMTENVSENQGKLKELLRKAKGTVREATEAAANANSIATKTNNLLEEFMQMSEQLKTLTVQLQGAAEKLKQKGEPSHSEESQKEKKLAEEYMKKAKDVESFLERVDSDSINLRVVEMAKQQAVAASAAAEGLQRIINNIFQEYPNIKAELDREIQETAQTNNNTTMTGSESETSPKENKELNGLGDSSSSPALVHSPLSLILVLMCVLGCTLVC